jgi:hypothetical protein
MNLETLERSLQALEERPDHARLADLRQQARVLSQTSRISAQTYSDLLLRLGKVHDQLRGGE